MPLMVCSLVVPMDSDRVAETLRPAVTGASAPFYGSVWAGGFRIMRVVRGRDSFNPVMYGRLFSAPVGTRVRVIMTFHPLVWVFMAVWSAFFAYPIASGGDSRGGMAMLIGLWAIGVPIFYYDALRSRRLLQEVLVSNCVMSGRGDR